MEYKTVDLILFAGQSNMSGRGDAEEAVVCPPGAGYEFHAVGEPSLTPVSEPFGRNENTAPLEDFNSKGVNLRTGSMVSAFMKACAAKTGVPVVGVSASKGGMPSVFFLTLSVQNEIAHRFKSAVTYLNQRGICVRRKAVVWCQGETDADRSTTEFSYKANLRALWEKFKSYGMTDMFIVRTGHFNYQLELGEDGKPTQDAYAHDVRYSLVNRWQEEFARAHEDVHVVADFYSDHYLSLMRDRFHYRQQAYNEIGTLAGQRVAQYLQ